MTTASDSKPFQFTLWHLSVVSFWLCVALALIVQLGGWGIFLSFAIGCGLMLYSRWRWGVPTLVEVVVMFLMAGTLFALLLPAISTPRGGTSRRSTCANNLRQIALALQMYHDRCGSFPPAYIADDAGRPMHSWRALILPELRPDLYAVYRFDEPWDGPNNIQLANIEIGICRCPACSENQPLGEVNYLAVVGPGTIWPGTESVSLDRVSDGAANTILLVEVHNSGIHWMEPRDLHVTQMPLAINPQRGMGISSLHRGGAMVAFADGRVELLPDNLDPETLRALLTMAADDDASLP